MIDNSIPMMAELYRNTGVGSLQGLETVVKANFREAQVPLSYYIAVPVSPCWYDAEPNGEYKDHLCGQPTTFIPKQGSVVHTLC